MTQAQQELKTRHKTYKFTSLTQKRVFDERVYASTSQAGRFPVLRLRSGHPNVSTCSWWYATE